MLPTAIFTDPELGSVGLTEHEARDAGHDVDVVKHPLPNVTRAQYTRTKHGLFKIVFDSSTRKVLGVHVVCRGASDIVGGLAPALTARRQPSTTSPPCTTSTRAIPRA